MDIKNLLNDINVIEQYEKQEFDYCPTSPITTWSSASSVSSSNTVLTTFTPQLKTKPQQQTRTPWTATEDYLLEKGYLQGLSWAMISAKYLPHRSRGCCWGRFKTLRAQSSHKKSRYTNEDHDLLGPIKKHKQLFKQAWRSVALDLNSHGWKERDARSTQIGLICHSQTIAP